MALREARASVSLDALGAAAGALAREIRGAAGDGITVSCPRRMAEVVEVAGFDPSASTEEVRGALAKGCGVLTEDMPLRGKAREDEGAGSAAGPGSPSMGCIG